jgi:preprotein translocase subunit SecF
MQFLTDTNFQFIKRRRIFLALSGILILGGLLSIFILRGFALGVDFAGGTLIQVQFEHPADLGEVRAALARLGHAGAEVSDFGEESEVLIRVAEVPRETGGVQKWESDLQAEFPDNPMEIRRTETVGPKIGAELKRGATQAVLWAMILMVVYISIRFQFRFAVAALTALAHDVAITLGIFSFLQKEITLPVIAAILTIVGYSLNDTIVVFDRVRENMRLKRGMAFPELVNLSINDTLSRTLITSLTTLIVVLFLYFLGGSVINDFAFTLIIGVIVGTYSSIYIASPILIWWQEAVGQRVSTAVAERKKGRSTGRSKRRAS